MFPEVVTTDESSDTLFYRPKRSGTGATIPGIRSKFFGLLDVCFVAGWLGGCQPA